MGNIYTKVATVLPSDILEEASVTICAPCHDREQKILLFGLDKSGKTTILYRTKIDSLIGALPTFGFVNEIVSYKRFNFLFWEVGYNEKLIPLWKTYYPNTRAIIWVIDATDRVRITLAAEKLRSVLKSPDLKGLPLLVLLNKTDIPKSMNVVETTKKLNLKQIKDRPWTIIPCSGIKKLNKSGILEGLNWLVHVLE
eukprot:TRINITY_DN13939_c0_g1_i1.p1 TRINITY_DN13939_c0_g1~~TRINITY_DN13939_c0_g1_i1.p1  ORF type:complete len:197 (-),score=21.15 TRINITY_DN13939_c0_g1_i1:6-596(-)